MRAAYWTWFLEQGMRGGKILDTTKYGLRSGDLLENSGYVSCTSTVLSVFSLSELGSSLRSSQTSFQLRLCPMGRSEGNGARPDELSKSKKKPPFAPTMAGTKLPVETGSQNSCGF